MDFSLSKLAGSSGAQVIGASGIAAGPISAILQNSTVGQAALGVGYKYAASGGALVKGVLAWFTNDGTPKYFQFPMNPDSFAENLSPEWATIKSPGQNRPTYHFVHGGEREISFTLHFFYENIDRRFIKDQLNELRSLTQRPRDSIGPGATAGPPAVYLYFGDYIQGDRFIVEKLNIKVFDLFDPLTLLPLRSEVEITLKEALDPALASENDPRSRLQIQSTGSLGGLIGRVGNPF